MIRINDVYGKGWTFDETDIDEIFFDNSHPNNWCVIVANGSRIKTYRSDLAVVLPKVIEDMALKI